MAERYTKQFMVRISDELFERINEDAVAQDRSMAYIARRILEDYYGVSSKKETFNAYKAEKDKLFLTPAKRKRKPVAKTKKG